MIEQDGAVVGVIEARRRALIVVGPGFSPAPRPCHLSARVGRTAPAWLFDAVLDVVLESDPPAVWLRP